VNDIPVGGDHPSWRITGFDSEKNGMKKNIVPLARFNKNKITLYIKI